MGRLAIEAAERIVVTARPNGVWLVDFDHGMSGGCFKSCKAALSFAGELADLHPGAGIRLQPGR